MLRGPQTETATGGGRDTTNETRPPVGDRPADAKTPVRRRNAAATKAHILAAAMDVFAAKGMDARIEDIAEAAGTNRAMAYYYFGSKEGLYLAALEATYLELVEKEQAIDIDRLDPLEAIVTLVLAKFEHYRRNPRYLTFLNIENMYEARYLKGSTRLAELQDPLFSVLRRVLARGHAEGVFRRDVDPVELYVSIIGLGYFAFSNRHTLKTVLDVDPSSEASMQIRKEMVVEMVTTYLTAGAAAKTGVRSSGARRTRARRETD